MIYIVLDTCVFAELIKEIEYDDVLNQILYWDFMGVVKIIVPSVIIDEWERNKSKFEKYRRDILKSKISNTKEMLKLLEINDLNIKESISNFDYDTNTIIEMDRIEELLNGSIILSISDNCKLKAAEFALEKLAPFKSKNSMGDALIAFSTIEFLEGESNYDAYFISHNTSDFSQDKQNKTVLHTDLKDDFDRVNLVYYSHLRFAVHKLVEKYNLPTRELIPKASDFMSKDDFDGLFDEFTNERIRDLTFSEESFIKRLAQNSAYIDTIKSSFTAQKVVFKIGFANTEFYAIKKCIEEAARVFRDFPDFDDIEVIIPSNIEGKIYSIKIAQKEFEERFNVNFQQLRRDVKNWRNFLNLFSKDYRKNINQLKDRFIKIENI